MVLNKILISREKLSSIPKSERLFFIEIGNLLNEMNTLQKVIFIAGKHTEEPLERRGRNLQALFFVRILAGKLSEAWELLRRDFFGAKLSQEYETRMDAEAKKSLETLKSYFSRQNLIHRIRNDFAFHYSSPEDLQSQLDTVPTEEVFELLLAPEHGNCLYSMSDVILNFSLLKAVHPDLNPVDPDDVSRAMDKVLGETFHVTRQFLDFLGECLVIIADRYLGLRSEPVEVRNPPVLQDLSLPYFVRQTEEKNGL